MPVNVSINDESGHIKFFNKKTKTIYGTSISADYLSLNSDYIIYSDLPLGADRQRAEVTFEWYDSTETRETYFFYPPGLFYLDEDQIEYLETCSMYFDNDSYPLDLSDLENDRLNISIIQGSEYVSVINDYTQQITGDNITIAFDSLYYFSLINDVVSDSNIVAIIRSEINGLVQTDTVMITPPKIKVIVEPAALSPGDTAKIILLQRYPDGTYASFPEGQLFYPDLTAGYDYASILYNGEMEDYFYEVPDNLKLFADDLGELDSVEVMLRVGTYINTEIPFSALQIEREKTERVSKIPLANDEAIPINNKMKKKKDGIKPKLIGGGSWGEYVEGFAKVIIKRPTLYVAFNPDTLSPGDTADVIIKLKKADGTLLDFPSDQLFEVGVIGGCEYGKILTSDNRTDLYFKDIQQPIRFIAADSIDADSAIVQLRVGIPEEKGLKLAKKNNKAKLSSNNYCSAVEYQYSNSGIGNGIVIKSGLDIIYPILDNHIEWITEEPKMPEIICKAKLKNIFFSGFYNLDWFFSVSWRRNHGGYTKKDLIGTVIGYSHDIVEIKIPWGEEIIGGDKVVLQLMAVTNQGIFKSKIENPFKILGKNPSIQAVKEGLTLQLQIIVYKETGSAEGKWNHFYSSGYPIFGPPHGYGLMQLDTPNTAQQYWNWKENKTEGISRLQVKYEMANAFYNRLRRVNHNVQFYNTDELLMQTFQLYNGGYYYNDWEPDDRNHPERGGKWKKGNPTVWPGHTDCYAEEAWAIYSDILNGIYPPYWD
jgi:hypothetical protein